MTDHATAVVWAPQPGAQVAFLASPYYEVLFEGTRGPGKTDALLMDFAQHCGQGYGPHWRGILFRRTYRQLADVVAKTLRWYPAIFPGITYNRAEHCWTWPDGEALLLRYLDGPADYWHYHGHEYPWIGWEELTNWPTAEGYELMLACSRASRPDMPRKLRATCNPYGIGHNWVKARFVDPAPAGQPIVGAGGLLRCRIHGDVTENKILLAADPDYLAKLNAIADPHRRRAWAEGAWDIVAGGMIDDLWDAATHALPPFPVPAGWRIDRSFDWGSTRPFSVGWWAESDGSDALLADGRRRAFPAGTLFRLAEWYGWSGKANDGLRLTAAAIARGILEREAALGLSGRVRPGPADSAIYAVENGNAIADDMAAAGIRWERAEKGPGSRRQGWQRLRARLAAARRTPMEDPGLFVFDTCRQFIRTVPTLPRSDDDPDDVDSSAEDHIADETRYRLLRSNRQASARDLHL